MRTVNSAVYPHLRGADRIGDDFHGSVPGVSPPAWGRLLSLIAHNTQKGCIPTCVGQTDLVDDEIIDHEVYPHLRGADHTKKPGPRR